LIAPFFTPFDWQKALLSGSLIALAGFAGDVTLSAIKRDIGVKDMSSMIPGHGGVMDSNGQPNIHRASVFLFCVLLLWLLMRQNIFFQ
jgi:predicted CDP-diglyceride synthetase/phosphatidate cytidylyltransferase